MSQTQIVTPTDLFVLMDKAFRRRTKRCRDCFFSLPYPVGKSSGNWAVDYCGNCSAYCQMVLEEIAGEYRGIYRLPSLKMRH